jgi:thiamine biosynthesis lipoprotein
MRSGRRLALWFAVALALIAHVSSVSLGADTLALVHQHRYAMGTMFDIIVYHASRPDAERAIDKALTEIVRLDQVLSHYKVDSDLAKLHREGRGAPVPVESSLYDVIEESIRFSRYSGGAFDVTIAPLLKLWKHANAEGRRPSANEIAAARRCVGYEQIETIAPDRVRLRSDCVELDLGGIGKGYAVDRAIAILKAEGIRHGLVNAGGSSITAIDAPPGAKGWPVAAGTGKIVLLRDSSMSTSQQNGEILDPRTGSPAAVTIHGGRVPGPGAVSVIIRSGTAADALSTALAIVPIADGRKLLERFPDAAALWIAPDGAVHATYGESRLVFQLADTR